MLAKLSVVTREGRERVHPILDDRVYILGRGERVDIRVPDNSASRSHCIIEKKGDAFTVLDLTSSNGTLLNGQRLGDTTSLKDGDEIQIGETRMKFCFVPDQERFALMTEVPEEGEFDPLAPAKRFVGWRESGSEDSTVIEPPDLSSETRMISAKDIRAAADALAAAEEEDEGPVLDLDTEDLAPTGEEPAAAEAEAEVVDLSEEVAEGPLDDAGEEAAPDAGEESPAGKPEPAGRSEAEVFELEDSAAADDAGKDAEPESEAATGPDGDGFELDTEEEKTPAGDGFELEPVEEKESGGDGFELDSADASSKDAADDGFEFEPEEEAAPPAKTPAGGAKPAPPPGKAAAKSPVPVPPPPPEPKAKTRAKREESVDDFDMEDAPEADPEEEAFAKRIVEMGFLDEDKVSLARMQREMDSTEKPLGMWMADRKLITWDQLKQVLAAQESGGGQDEEAERRWTKRENVLFGKLAVKKEFITQEQLDECLAEQVPGKPKRNIGEILVQKGHMTKGQVDKILRAQEREVLRCTDCDAAYLVGNLPPGKKLKCKTCGTMLTVQGK